ncbi:hypothetical protein NDU88_005630 [Pleurodeles waltl]|uniref:Uncharacterized protein n=1 Tax=Pleurodeles waltl TaxID=8319 RepID=A0AAV7TBV7_PLEWA|nr:hypothetical protein NDU88_005630 [Pleurodeles waltl]
METAYKEENKEEEQQEREAVLGVQGKVKKKIMRGGHGGTEGEGSDKKRKRQRRRGGDALDRLLGTKRVVRRVTERICSAPFMCSVLFMFARHCWGLHPRYSRAVSQPLLPVLMPGWH